MHAFDLLHEIGLFDFAAWLSEYLGQPETQDLFEAAVFVWDLGEATSQPLRPFN